MLVLSLHSRAEWKGEIKWEIEYTLAQNRHYFKLQQCLLRQITHICDPQTGCKLKTMKLFLNTTLDWDMFSILLITASKKIHVCGKNRTQTSRSTLRNVSGFGSSAIQEDERTVEKWLAINLYITQHLKWVIHKPVVVLTCSLRRLNTDSDTCASFGHSNHRFYND